MSVVPPPVPFANLERAEHPAMPAVFAFGVAWGGFVSIRHVLYWGYLMSTPRFVVNTALAAALLEIAGYAIIVVAMLTSRSTRVRLAIAGFGIALLAVVIAGTLRVPETLRIGSSSSPLFRLWNLWSILGGAIVPSLGLLFSMRATARIRP